jgi:hypothetical protein
MRGIGAGDNRCSSVAFSGTCCRGEFPAAVLRPVADTGRRARPALLPGVGEIAGNMGSSNCNGVAVPALAVISTSNGREKPPVETGWVASPLVSVTKVVSEEPRRTFIACRELPSSPEISTGSSASGRKIMLFERNRHTCDRIWRSGGVGGAHRDRLKGLPHADRLEAAGDPLQLKRGGQNLNNIKRLAGSVARRDAHRALHIPAS